MPKRFPPSSGPAGQNPIQDQADRTRKIRFRGKDGKLTDHLPNEIPRNLKPHPNVTPKLGPQQPLPEDRPAGSPPTP